MVCVTSTVKVWVLLVPPGVVTLTFLTLSVVAGPMANTVVIVVEFTTFVWATLTPVPDTATLVPVAVKLEPVSVMGKLLNIGESSRTSVLGVTEDSVGGGG